MFIVPVAAAMVVASLAGPGVRVWHFPAGEPLDATVIHPITGDTFAITGATTAGDWIRRNADGTFSAGLTLAGRATFDIEALAGGPEFAGEGRYTFVGGVIPHDPENPLAGASFGDDNLTIHVDSALADAAGGLWRLTAHVVARDGVFRLFDVELAPK